MDTTNYLSPASFIISIDRIPDCEFSAQKINIPGLSAGFADTGSPIAAVLQTGGRLVYDDLTMSFLINENMTNYLEIHDWLVGINTPQTQAQWRNFKSGKDGSIKSDITIVVTNSHKNANMKINFVDCFPVSISDIQLDITATDIEYPEASVTFKYNYFTIEQMV